MRKELVIGVILVAVLVGFLEWRNAPVEQAIRYEHLRACDATIQDGTSAQMSAERCYFFTHSDKGKQ